MKILGVIPARGGSKGIPHKNRKLLGGRPLMQYTIEAALASKEISAVIFSSEDQQLRTLAKELGVSVPFVRPDHLATDSSGSLEVVQHAIKEMEKLGEVYDAVCLLQVTTPFRTSEEIDIAIRRFREAKTDALISVQEVPHQYNPHWVFETTDTDHLKIATGEKEIIKRRQELPPAYIRDGGIYITKTSVLIEKQSFFGDSVSYVHSDKTRYVNIDTMDDWEKAESIIKENKQQKV
ncbi:cytidylyltransferase domain-containing protein [Dokdonia ponticola]|uniref:Cytidylyltransferase domain-containing protein n=1 Tax=Dokdonia ponticola TaxID=2041041 RepID=A0ABV9I1L3_9FLAO